MATPHESRVVTRGNRSTRRNPAMLGRVKLDNTLFTNESTNFNRIKARGGNRNLVEEERGMGATGVPSKPFNCFKNRKVKLAEISF